jgi:F0F1-type ATP synthase membrane subunit b/b'
MLILSRLNLLFASSFLLLLLPSLAFASPEAAHTAPPSLTTYLLNSNVFNFLLVAAFLLWLANKFKLLESLQNQPKQISATLLDSETLLSGLTEKKSQLKNDLAQLNQVRQEELAKAEQMAAVMLATLKQKTVLEQERLQEAERREKQRLAQLNSQALLSSLATELLASTRQRLLQGLDASQHRRLVESAIAQLEA